MNFNMFKLLAERKETNKMKLKILCPQWGSEHLEIEAFLAKVKEGGYDGVDTWLPENKKERISFIRLLNDYNLSMVSHQH